MANTNTPDSQAEGLLNGLKPEDWLYIDGVSFQTSMNTKFEVKGATHERAGQRDGIIHHSHSISPLGQLRQDQFEEAVAGVGQYRVGTDFILFRSDSESGGLFVGSSTAENRNALDRAGLQRALNGGDRDSYLPQPENFTFPRRFEDENSKFFQRHKEAMASRRTEQMKRGFNARTNASLAPSIITISDVGSSSLLEPGAFTPPKAPVAAAQTFTVSTQPPAPGDGVSTVGFVGPLQNSDAADASLFTTDIVSLGVPITMPPSAPKQTLPVGSSIDSILVPEAVVDGENSTVLVSPEIPADEVALVTSDVIAPAPFSESQAKSAENLYVSANSNQPVSSISTADVGLSDGDTSESTSADSETPAEGAAPAVIDEELSADASEDEAASSGDNDEGSGKKRIVEPSPDPSPDPHEDIS